MVLFCTIEIKAIQNNLIAAEQHLNHVIVQLHPSTTPIKSGNQHIPTIILLIIML